MYKVLAAAALRAASVVTEKIMQSDKTELREVGQDLASAVMRVHQSLRTKATSAERSAAVKAAVSDLMTAVTRAYAVLWRTTPTWRLAIS